MESKKILVDESLLLEIKTGILEAIYNEDGLDGADGERLLSGINLLLGLPVDDHNLPDPPQAAAIPPHPRGGQ